jgi:hypothetical protein
VQSAALRQLVAASARTTGELWRVTADPTTLQAGACYPRAAARSARSTPTPRPATSATGGPDRRRGPRAPAGGPRRSCFTSARSRGSTARASRPWAPACAGPRREPRLEGLQIAVSLLEPRTNLQQDARQVATIFHHFITHTAPLIARVPIYQPGRAEPGHLYRRGGLYVHQGSLHVAGLDGPRGHIAAPAYNYIIRRFAELLRRPPGDAPRPPEPRPEIQQLAKDAADPCLRQHVQEVARAV